MKLNPILQLLKENREVARPKALFHRVDAKDDKPAEVTLYLYDFIVNSSIEAEYWGGCAAQDIVPEIRKLGNEDLAVRINSPGGDVFAGQAICQAIRDHKGKSTAYVDGDAASIASVIAVACDEVVIAAGGMMMIHNSSTIVWGDRNDMLDMAAVLEKVDGTIAAAYAAKTGKKAEEFGPMMDKTTWFTGQEAVDIGLADRVAESVKAESKWNLSAYANAPADRKQPAKPAPKGDTPQNNAPQPEYASQERRDRLQQRARIALTCAP